MVRVDETGQHDVSTGVELARVAYGWHRPGRHQFGDTSISHNHAATRVISEDTERIADP